MNRLARAAEAAHRANARRAADQSAHLAGLAAERAARREALEERLLPRAMHWHPGGRDDDRRHP